MEEYKKYLKTKYSNDEGLYSADKHTKSAYFDKYSDIFEVTEYECINYKFRFLKYKWER